MCLWIASTWFVGIARVAPLLNVKSPQLRCGKSTLLALIGRLVPHPLLASNVTPAALFRTFEKCCPTLIIDEVDSFFSENGELRGIINSGHSRDTAFVVRTVGDDHEPRRFSTWGFKAIAGIGSRAATIEDRSITIELARKLPNEKVDRLRYSDPAEFEATARQLARWAIDYKAAIAARPAMPDSVTDRQADNWEGLFSIAAIAGGAWPRKALEAALCARQRRMTQGHKRKRCCLTFGT